jgi:uncharacterized pyridoxamine 5'-phosphate oxidase family protein
MSKVSEFLTANPVQYLATVSLDGKAKCRPFMFSFEKDGKLWFNTGNFKDVYKELQNNPNIQISVSSPEYPECLLQRGYSQPQIIYQGFYFVSSPVLNLS